MSSYQAYAPIYHTTGQGQLSVQLAHLALGWGAWQVPPTAVLDLACGAGDALLVYAAAGCRTVGVDASAPMLAIADARARDAVLAVSCQLADIRHLEAADLLGDGQVFDLVTCFASLNELANAGDLTRVANLAAQVLAPGGRLVFDLCNEAEYTNWMHLDRSLADGPDHIVVEQLHYQPKNRLASVRIVWFVREIDRWWRGEEWHTQRAWADREVVAALAEAGLTLEARLTPAGVAADTEAARVVYLAQRKV